MTQYEIFLKYVEKKSPKFEMPVTRTRKDVHYTSFCNGHEGLGGAPWECDGCHCRKYCDRYYPDDTPMISETFLAEFEKEHPEYFI